MANPEQIGRRVAIASMIVSGSLAVLKIGIGILAGSMAVISDGVESGADVFASAMVLFGLSLAAKPPDEDHPYGHGRMETISGLGVGIMLGLTGSGICFQAALRLDDRHRLETFAIWPLLISMAAKFGLSMTKFRIGRRIKSDALVADAWNDSVDILSALAALVGVSFALWKPDRFYSADSYGAVCVGILVVLLGMRVVYDTAQQLMDRMPSRHMMAEIRRVALQVPEALAVEKCYARKTGLRYYVDLHLEVRPEMTVRDSHQVAHDVQARILEELDWVAGVLVHVEPHPAATI
jgi:cation diffusion facilitator family transporter